MSYPEHDKLVALGERKNEIQNFIDWLLDEQDITLGMYGEERWPNSRAESSRRGVMNEHHLYNLERAGHPLVYTFKGKLLREKIMAAYFDIDLKKIDDEKDQMLAQIRAENEKKSYGFTLRPATKKGKPNMGRKAIRDTFRAASQKEAVELALAKWTGYAIEDQW